MKPTKTNIHYKLNADGSAQPAASQPAANTPWYGYIGSWMQGIGNIIGSTKEPADINYYSYANSSNQSSSSLIIILALAAVVLLFFIKK
ncbi:MAG: hypothetical protein J6V54_10775 [Bacteroidales bacterium]|nr:hypothetical protein [Bacteroidales bacterium]